MTTAVIWALITVCSLSVNHVTGMGEGNPCSSNPCGQNTQCILAGGRPTCSCLPGHWGNPLTYCQKGECQDSNDCPHNRACKDYKCVDVCVGECGLNAQCLVRNHVPVCSCPARYTGDPFRSCRFMDPQELCQPSPCGRNTKCEVINDTPTCSCLPGYVGSPLQGCHHECDSDYDCLASQSCQNYHCVAACSTGICATSANCIVNNHRPVCSCPPGYLGDPYLSCQAECLSHGDCPASKPSCLNAKCMDPCAGVCGINANCRVENGIKAICSCPRHMTGDPFTRCRPFEKSDLCNPNPCGTNAQCTPGHDNTGKERPVCTCLLGYVGNALRYCQRGECTSDSDCRHDQNCLNYSCVSSCSNKCGVSADCNARNHIAYCSCPQGYTGDASTRCYSVPPPVARAIYN